jgi:excisionase family DNA binding protein
MSQAKGGIRSESCARATVALPQTNAAFEDQTMARDLGHGEDDLKKLEAMSDVQKTILAQLAPLSPQALHSDALREAVAPFLAARDKKGQRRELEVAVGPLVLGGFVRYFCCMVDSYALNPRHENIIAHFADSAEHSVPWSGNHVSPIVSDERCFTLKEAAKLLGVSKMSIKRRIKSKKISAIKRLGKRGGFEVVIPQSSLSLEVISFIPDSRPLTLSDYEALVIERLKAMTSQSDRHVSKALKELCKEFRHLVAEAHACSDTPVETVLQTTSKKKALLKGDNKKSARLSLVPRRSAPRSSKNE